ncbi:UDP-N-acetyl-D-mannosamine transferase [Spirochaetia bacterium]|nr:UDP-N-acetyl-D-mannosamine transferase [Spirochaetia bacterium]
MEELRERIEVLGIPVDIVSQENLDPLFSELLNKTTPSNIVLLSVWDLLRARHSGEYRNFVLNAALVIPISKSIVRGAKFLTGKTPFRYMPFNFVVRILTILERRELCVYLLGGKRILSKTENNIRQTFPKLRIIGRYPGLIKKQDEDTVLTVIRKSSPNLLLVGRGVQGREKWLAKNDVRLNPGIRLWCSDLFEVFAKRKKRPNRVIFDHGLEWIAFCFQKPLRFFRIFPYIGYNFLLIARKIKTRKK